MGLSKFQFTSLLEQFLPSFRSTTEISEISEISGEILPRKIGGRATFNLEKSAEKGLRISVTRRIDRESFSNCFFSRFNFPSEEDFRGMFIFFFFPRESIRAS